MVGDEQLWGLVRVRPAVGKELAFIERFAGVRDVISNHRNPKVGNREMSLRRDEDISRLQVAVDD